MYSGCTQYSSYISFLHILIISDFTYYVTIIPLTNENITIFIYCKTT